MKKICILFVSVVGLLCTSCYSTRVMHGSVKQNEPLVQVNKVWNHHLIGGLIPVGNNKIQGEEYVDNAENYVVKTNFSFLNFLVSGITCGIYTPTQTKFYLPLSEVQNGKVQVKKIKTDE